jgi:four helix bundle protein
MLKNFKELKVWQKSCELYLEIYKITGKFPNEGRYGLTSQIRRSVVSIPSNIAEEYGRKTTMDYIRMLYISYGAEIERMLRALIKSLENKPLNP